MTVLRSREIVVTVSSKGSPRKASENGATEPATPARTLEFANQSSISTTPSSSSSALNPTIELRFESSTVRRSARLATKLGIGVHLENDDEIVSGKKKKVRAKVDRTTEGSFEIGRLEKRCLDSDLEAEKVGRFSKQRRTRSRLSPNSGNGPVSRPIPVLEEVKLESDEDLSVLESGNKDGEEKVFFNFRSGKEVGKNTMGGNFGGPSIGCKRVESFDNDADSGYGKESKILLNDSDVMSDPVRNVEEDISNNWKKRRLSRAEKGKGKMVAKTLMMGSAINMNLEVDKEVGLLIDDSSSKLPESVDGQGSNTDQNAVENGAGVMTRARLRAEEKWKGKLVDEDSTIRGRLCAEEKGKGKLVDEDSMTRVRLLSEEKGKGKLVDEDSMTRARLRAEEKGKGKLVDEDSMTRARLRAEEKGKGKGKLVDEYSSSKGVVDALDQSFELRAENRNENAHAVSIHLPEDATLVDVNIVRERDARAYKNRFRDIARQNASRFAHFSAEEEDQGRGAADISDRHSSSSEEEDWPGPFSTALKIVRDREKIVNGMHWSSVDKSKAVELTWVPRKDGQSSCQKQFLPSLQDLCLSVLAKNADAISSLDFVPDSLRHKLCKLLSDSRKMNSHVLQLLVSGFPTEIRLRDCSWLSEELFTQTFESIETTNLTVLQLDQCGCCVPDYALSATLARSLNSLPALTTVSLKGAYRLSDAGLSALVSSAPSITSINLTECSLLTSDGICSLAKSLRSVLRELYIDDCLEIDAMLILPALLKLEHLQVLSLGGIQTVCDNFISEIVCEHGCRIKELGLARCLQLSDLSLKVIAATCVELQVIDLMNLCKLTDTAMAHLASGCRAIHTLKLCRNSFSDEAIAAYIEISGASLVELSLNNINKVSNNTALSLARHSKNIVTLDLSFCRNLTNEALGLIVDSCTSLEVLKLFGCTQVTNVFLDGHSNPQVKIIGMKMTQVFDRLKEPDFL